jgi:DNA-directed RNA polymerase subunit RPC12/RpoP
MHEIDQLIARLEAEHTLIGERLRLARELRATFDTGAAPATAPVSPPAEPAKPTTDIHVCDDCAAEFDSKRGLSMHRNQRHGNPTTYDQVACPDCGRMVAKSQLANHRRSKHPSSAAKPIAPVPAPKVEPAPVPDSAPVSTSGVYECNDCEARTPNKQALAKHTTEKHRRGLYAEEHLMRHPSLAAVS